MKYEYLNFVRRGEGKLNDELIMAMLCDKHGWTYDEYLDCPTWFIRLLMLKSSTDAEIQNQQIKKQQKSNGKRRKY